MSWMKINRNTGMTRKLNIVMVTLIRLHQSKGGIERVMIDTANAMVEKGHNVTIIFSDKKGSDPGFSLDPRVKLINYARNEYPFTLCGVLRNIRAISFNREEYRRKRILLACKAKAFQLKELVKDQSADVYITYDPRITWILHEELGVRRPIISTMHFSPEAIAMRSEFCWVKKSLEQAGPIQVLMPSYVERMRRFVPDAKEIISIPNVVLQDNVKALLVNPKIINVGRVSKQKNQKTLAAAWKLIKDQFPDWSVEVWGEKDFNKKYSAELERYIKANELGDRFLLCGKTDRVNEKLQSSSIFAFPSIDEGFSLALTEAMTKGLPCVGLTECPSVNELIQHGKNGLLCENTPESLARALAFLMENFEVRRKMGEYAAKGMEEYSPQNVWDQWERLLLRIA